MFLSNIKNNNNNNLKHPINILAKKVVLFTNARNEIHIKEWAAHHLLIGFDKIIIFDHKSDIPLKTVFHGFDKRVITIGISKMENGIKMPLMNVALKMAKNLHADWFIYLDADEFIILHNSLKSVKQLLNLHNDADSLAINWLMFGSNYLKTEPTNLMLESYTRCSSELVDLVKCFVRPHKALNATNPHHYNMMDLDRCNGTNHKKIKANCSINKHKVPYALSYAYIAHYVYQSEESFTKRKLMLPADDTGTFRQGVNNLQTIHALYNDVENTYPKEKYAKNVQAFLTEMENLKNILTESSS
jgi:hypothetical protein